MPTAILFNDLDFEIVDSVHISRYKLKKVLQSCYVNFESQNFNLSTTLNKTIRFHQRQTTHGDQECFKASRPSNTEKRKESNTHPGCSGLPKRKSWRLSLYHGWHHTANDTVRKRSKKLLRKMRQSSSKDSTQLFIPNAFKLTSLDKAHRNKNDYYSGEFGTCEPPLTFNL